MIKYRKAKEIIDQVADDLSSYDESGLIDYGRLYKIIRSCNAFLGEKINPEKQHVVKVDKFRGVLPSDFSSLNFALACTRHTVNVTPPKGFQIEVCTKCPGNTKTCSPCLTDCDGEFTVYQKLDEKWTQFVNLETVAISSKSFNRCSTSCPNIFVRSHKVFEIGANDVITTNFECGDLYINYVGSMDDDDDDLMVIDHDLVRPYYENELIKAILKMSLYNKDADVSQLYGDAKIEASRAKIDAMNFINMPGYNEIRNLSQAQRVRLYKKYFVPFISC